MAGTVVSQLTNVTLAESGDSAGWDDIGSGPGSSQSSDLPIQGAENRGRRADNATDKGMSFDTTTTLDLSAAGTHVAWWVNVLQPGALTVLDVILGGGSTPTTSPWSSWEGYNAGVPYPPVGGWRRLWLDPTKTRENGAGTLSLSALRQFGIQVTIGNVGGTSLNLNIDRIDYADGGGGLLLHSGTVPSPATIDDVVTDDETNAYGVIFDTDGGLVCLARVTVGRGSEATIWTDTPQITFGDQPLVAVDFMGLTLDLSHASSVYDLTRGFLKSKNPAGNLGDLVVTGTSGSLDWTGPALTSLRVVTLTNACTLTGAVIQDCGLITAAGADLTDSSVIAASGVVALLWDVATDTDGLLDGLTFESSGTGHAIELGTSCATDITLNDWTATGYAAVDGSTGDEVLYNNSGKAITVRPINPTGTITVRNGAGATTTVVAAQVTTTLVANVSLVGAEIRIYDRDVALPALGTEISGVESAPAATYAFTTASANLVHVQVQLAGYEEEAFDLTVPSSSGDFPITLTLETNA